ncbi:MAG: hypothetical protein V1715_12340 [bacterium]
MRNLIWTIIGLAVLGFVLAAVFVLFNVHWLGLTAEGLSRGCSNLALIAIAIMMADKQCCKSSE